MIFADCIFLSKEYILKSFEVGILSPVTSYGRAIISYIRPVTSYDR